jgi:SH3-like domain-containing protein
MAMRFRAPLLILALSTAFAAPATAQNREVPYWASLKANEVYMRVGPSADYPIDWVYHRAQLPVKVIRVREGWGLLEDAEGTRGWVARSMLRDDRTALVTGQGLAPIRDKPADAGALKWNAEPGVIGRLGDCEQGWCEIDVGGRKGWISAARIWGDGEP